MVGRGPLPVEPVADRLPGRDPPRHRQRVFTAASNVAVVDPATFTAADFADVAVSYHRPSDTAAAIAFATISLHSRAGGCLAAR